MSVLIFVSIFAILFVQFSPCRKKSALMISLTILAVVSSIRYGVGTDYFNYLEIFKNISQYSNEATINNIFQGKIYKDPLWSILNLVFSGFGINGFFMLVASISCFQIFVIYTLIKRYVEPQYWGFSLFIYLFNPYFFVLELSMLRQTTAMSFCILAFILFKNEKKNIPLVIFLIICAVLTHSSALIMVCLIPILFWKIKRTHIVAVTLSISFIIVFLFRNSLGALIEPFLQVEQFDILYEKYMDRSATSTFGIGFLLNTIPFIFFIKSFYYTETSNLSQKRIIFLSSIGILIIPVSAMVQMISRIALYFSIFSVVSIPEVYKRQYNLKTILISIYIFSELMQYYLLYMGPGGSKGYNSFHTIFENI